MIMLAPLRDDNVIEGPEGDAAASCGPWAHPRGGWTTSPAGQVKAMCTNHDHRLTETTFWEVGWNMN